MKRQGVNKRLIIFFDKFCNKPDKNFFENFFFGFICFFEFFYRFVFLCVNFVKKRFGHKKYFSFKVFSVGNLSVGGTGKSVFVQFLINNLKEFKGAVVLRGYKSANEKTGKSFLVSDGNGIFCDVDFCGDEAFMAAKSLQSPIVIGVDRVASCSLLVDKKAGLDFVVLDDAYQNHNIKKDFEVLLLDARKPFENNHCLPAGRLREKDFSRADVIILTHADVVCIRELENIKNNLLSNFDRNYIFSGMHKVVGLSYLGEKNIVSQNLKGKKFLVFAGIGSFQNFVDSVKDLGVELFESIEYTDHHKYLLEDLRYIIELIKKHKLDGVITTQKDWYKISPLLKKIKDWQVFPFYILNVSFEFLHIDEKNRFLNLMMKSLQ